MDEAQQILAGITAQAPSYVPAMMASAEIFAQQKKYDQCDALLTKVLERVEGMLASTDRVFTGLGYLKQEAGLGRLKGHERDIAELERTNQEMQDTVFALMQQMQFQDIARQKLERVMVHLKGMQGAISGKLR